VTKGRPPGRHDAWIGLGSNLGDREGALRSALFALACDVIEVSSIWETEPWGVTDQPWFLNAVVCIHWDGPADELLEVCLSTEVAMGRTRDQRNGPRQIDLDLLALGTVSVDRPGLRVPHPGISSRRSVLEPWAEIAADLILPGHARTLGALRDAAAGLPGQAAVRVPGRTLV
jgi:2-amino-4-hydroxy-6-hydroxymethyldihydropteridine diphosphokinase